jgi:hypothetical protein
VKTEKVAILPNATIFTISEGTTGLVTLYDSNTQLILFADTNTAHTFWNPTLPGASDDPLSAYWLIGTNHSILIGGPYLVRNASIDSTGTTLSLRGDLNASTPLTVLAPRAITTITWNGAKVSFSRAPTISSQGAFTGKLTLSSKATGVNVTLPNLAAAKWKFNNSLPEIVDGFDDGEWVVANKTTTNIPFKPFYGDGRILYGCDYGL